MREKLPYFVIATALVCTVILAAWFWPRLPQQVATHFDAAGQPDGWMSRLGFVAMMLGIQFGTAAFFIAIGWCSWYLPESMLNIPNREYWLAEERRAETLADSNRLLAWVAAATSMFMLLLFFMTFQANVDGRGLNSVAFWIAITVYLFFVIGGALVHVRKYHRVPLAEQKSL